MSTEISLNRNEMIQARDPVVFSTDSHKLWEHKRMGRNSGQQCLQTAADLSYSESICMAFGMKM